MTTMPTDPFDPMTINFGAPQMQTPFSLPTAPGSFMPTGQAMGGIGAALGQGNFLQRSGLGMNMPTFGLALGGLQTLGGLWGGFKQLDLAKKQLAFTKGMANANLTNQTQSYNTAIEDRARARGVTEGQSQTQVDDYITKNSLAKRTVG